MNFNSLPFVVLFALTLLLYYAPKASTSWQVSVLVLASVIFYAWDEPYLVLLLLFCVLTTSLVSVAIARTDSILGQRVLAVSGVAAMLAVLAFFKYNRLIYD